MISWSYSALNLTKSARKLTRFAAVSAQASLDFPSPGDQLPFLNFTLHFGNKYTCWTYAPRSKKDLHFSSHYSKLVKHAITLKVMRNALGRSCPYQVAPSFTHQVDRLKKACFPEQFLSGLAKVILRECRLSKKKAQPEVDRASDHDPLPALRLPQGEEDCCACGIESGILGAHKTGFLLQASECLLSRGTHLRKKHASRFIPCVAEVAYVVPTSCGGLYIGHRPLMPLYKRPLA